MTTTTQQAASNASLWRKYHLYLHALIMLLLILGIGALQPIGTLTPVGMKLSAIFIAALYGWTTCGLFWPSLIAILALAFSGAFETLSQFLATSFGSETMVFVLFLFAFTEVINEVGLVDYIANKMISFKFLERRPWLFSFVFLLAAYVCAMLINMFATIFVCWNILYVIARRFDFKPYDKYPTLMIIGITLASIIGGVVMPYKPVPLIVLRAYTTVSGESVDFLQYVMFSLPMSFLVMVFFILICRFVFRPELGELKQLNVDFVDKKALVLDAKQKIVLLFLLVFIFMMLAPSLLPKTWLLAVFINKLGMAGCLIFLVVLMSLIQFDHQPLLNFKEMSAKGFNWDIYVTMCFVVPFAGLFTSDATGIKPFIVSLVQPILSTLSPLAFMIITMLLATILTNFANNMVVAAVFATMIFTLGNGLGLEIMPLIAVLILCSSLSMVTPAACPNAAVMFANTQWCRTKDLYKYCFILIAIAFVLTVSVGLIWANIIY